ncbi:MAG TPA: hypothetical protein VJJ79_03055 [Candidatus Nanoarchaeia archaeon]|nr:hypothetical protein [Candidatus Nanoarchaeia archaeon]
MVEITSQWLRALDILYNDQTDSGKRCAAQILEVSARYINLLAKDTVDSDVGRLGCFKRGTSLDEEVEASFVSLQDVMKHTNQYLASIGVEKAFPEKGREHLYQIANNVVTRFYEARIK